MFFWVHCQLCSNSMLSKSAVYLSKAGLHSGGTRCPQHTWMLPRRPPFCLPFTSPPSHSFAPSGDSFNALQVLLPQGGHHFAAAATFFLLLSPAGLQLEAPTRCAQLRCSLEKARESTAGLAARSLAQSLFCLLPSSCTWCCDKGPQSGPHTEFPRSMGKHP